MNISGLNEEEKLLINSGLSMVGGVAIGTVQGTYQYLINGGHVTFGSAVTFAVGGFLAGLGIALKVYIPAHAQQMLADAQARATELEQALHLATTAQPVSVTPAQPTPVAAPVSPVTIHFNGVPMVNPPEGGSVIAQPAMASINTPTANTAGTVTIIGGRAGMPEVQSPAQSVQLTMTAAPAIASTPDLSSEDTAVRKSVTIVS